jgi:hypothetical protein
VGHSLSASQETSPAGVTAASSEFWPILGQALSDHTMGNILRGYETQPAARRSQNTTWKDLIASDLAVLAGTD